MTLLAPDLFATDAAQRDLFAADAGPNPGVGRARPEEVRARLLTLLQEARASASAPPWSERDTRMYRIVFPQMANWLPEEEAARLRRDFAQEMERLEAQRAVS